MRNVRTFSVLGLALTLGGCGFHPLYAIPDAPHGSMKSALGSIYVEPVPERVGYELRNALIDLIDARSTARGAAYHLRLKLTEKSEAVSVQSQTVGSVTQTAITRYNDRLTVDYQLIDARTNQVVTSGTETGLSSYNVLASPYATLTSRQDADRHLAEDVADRLRIDLAVYFAQSAQPRQ